MKNYIIIIIIIIIIIFITYMQAIYNYTEFAKNMYTQFNERKLYVVC
jgi:hypothetical protein